MVRVVLPVEHGERSFMVHFITRTASCYKSTQNNIANKIENEIIF